MSADNLKMHLFRDGYIILPDTFFDMQAVVDSIFEEYLNIYCDSEHYFTGKYENAIDLVDENKRTEIQTKLNGFNLEDSISSIVGVSLKLTHTQLRFVKSNTPSYMPLHRDVQIYNNKLVGPLPAPYKLIFYPKTIKPEDCLKVVPRSNRLTFSSKLFDLGINLLLNGLKTINFGKTKAILFDTTILHHVPVIKNDSSSARLILTFTPQ